MWTFYIREGLMVRPDGETLGPARSGFGSAMNDPGRTAEKNVGPLPVGFYSIGAAHRHPTCGPVSMRLTPHPGTYMHGRGGMLLHGPNGTPDPTDDSHGCIILSLGQRAEIAQSTDRVLEVVAELPVSGPLPPADPLPSDPDA